MSSLHLKKEDTLNQSPHARKRIGLVSLPVCFVFSFANRCNWLAWVWRARQPWIQVGVVGDGSFPSVGVSI